MFSRQKPKKNSLSLTFRLILISTVCIILLSEQKNAIKLNKLYFDNVLHSMGLQNNVMVPNSIYHLEQNADNTNNSPMQLATVELFNFMDLVNNGDTFKLDHFLFFSEKNNFQCKTSVFFKFYFKYILLVLLQFYSKSKFELFNSQLHRT
jgi:hypothetical protein